MVARSDFIVPTVPYGSISQGDINVINTALDGLFQTVSGDVDMKAFVDRIPGNPKIYVVYSRGAMTDNGRGTAAFYVPSLFNTPSVRNDFFSSGSTTIKNGYLNQHKLAASSASALDAFDSAKDIILAVDDNFLNSASTLFTDINGSNKNMSRERVLFHELAHGAAVWKYSDYAAFNTQPDASGESPILVFENLAVAAENLFWIKAAGGDVRVGHTTHSTDSFDPTLPFDNTTNVRYDLEGAASGGDLVGVFRADVASGGTVSKHYFQNEFNTNALTIGSGTNVGRVDNLVLTSGREVGQSLINENGTLSPLISQVLSGVAADQQKVTASLSRVASTLNDLKEIATQPDLDSAKIGSVPILAAAIDDWTYKSLGAVEGIVGYSNEISVSNRVRVGPVVSKQNNNRPARTLPIDSAWVSDLALAGSIIVGSSGFYAPTKNVDYRARFDTLTGTANPYDTDIVLAGSGQGPSGELNYISGAVEDILVGGENDDYYYGQGDGVYYFVSPGNDTIVASPIGFFNGFSKNDYIILAGLSYSDVEVDAKVNQLGKVVITFAGGSSTTQVEGGDVFIGGSQKITFRGNGFSYFVAGSGGGDFYIRSGDVAVGNDEAVDRFYIYAPMPQDIDEDEQIYLRNANVTLVNIGPEDELYINGTKSNGYSKQSTTGTVEPLPDPDRPEFKVKQVVYSGLSSYGQSYAAPVLVDDEFMFAPGAAFRDVTASNVMVGDTPSMVVTYSAYTYSGTEYTPQLSPYADLEYSERIAVTIVGYEADDLGLSFMQDLAVSSSEDLIAGTESGGDRLDNAIYVGSADIFDGDEDGYVAVGGTLYSPEDPQWSVNGVPLVDPNVPELIEQEYFLPGPYEEEEDIPSTSYVVLAPDVVFPGLVYDPELGVSIRSIPSPGQTQFLSGVLNSEIGTFTLSSTSVLLSSFDPSTRIAQIVSNSDDIAPGVFISTDGNHYADVNVDIYAREFPLIDTDSTDDTVDEDAVSGTYTGLTIAIDVPDTTGIAGSTLVNVNGLLSELGVANYIFDLSAAVGPAITYSLTTNPGGAFSIDAETGRVTVANATALSSLGGSAVNLGVLASTIHGERSSTFSLEVTEAQNRGMFLSTAAANNPAATDENSSFSRRAQPRVTSFRPHVSDYNDEMRAAGDMFWPANGQSSVEAVLAEGGWGPDENANSYQFAASMRVLDSSRGFNVRRSELLEKQLGQLRESLTSLNTFNTHHSIDSGGPENGQMDRRLLQMSHAIAGFGSRSSVGEKSWRQKISDGQILFFA